MVYTKIQKETNTCITVIPLTSDWLLLWYRTCPFSSYPILSTLRGHRGLGISHVQNDKLRGHCMTVRMCEDDQITSLYAMPIRCSFAIILVLGICKDWDKGDEVIINSINQQVTCWPGIDYYEILKRIQWQGISSRNQVAVY